MLWCSILERPGPARAVPIAEVEGALMALVSAGAEVIGRGALAPLVAHEPCLRWKNHARPPIGTPGEGCCWFWWGWGWGDVREANPEAMGFGGR